MPTRRVAAWETPPEPCADPEHEPPKTVSLESGLYEHECPGCGAKLRFKVDPRGRLG